MEVRFSICTIEPDMGARMRFKQAATPIYAFNRVSLHPTISEGYERIKLDGPFDIVFISERFPEKDLAIFLKGAKEHKNSQDAAFVLLIGAGQNLETRTSNAILAGFHGCLMEPYSVDALLEIAKLTCEVKKSHEQSRQKGAMDTLIKTMIHQVDRIAYLQACQMDPGQFFKNFKDTCRTLSELDQDQLRIYLEEVVDLFEKTTPDETICKRRKYMGVSRRVKQNMIKKLLRQEEDEHWNLKKIKF